MQTRLQFELFGFGSVGSGHGRALRGTIHIFGARTLKLVIPMSWRYVKSYFKCVITLTQLAGITSCEFKSALFWRFNCQL